MDDTVRNCGLLNRNTNPFSDEPEQVNFFEWLPNEMLCAIFRQVDHPKDLVSCSKVSTHWDALLHRRKAYILFCEVLPLFSKYLTWNTHLLLRKVCHGWKLVVDDYLDDKMTETNCFQNLRRRIPLPFYHTDEIQTFMRDMENVPPSQNPIPDRTAFFNSSHLGWPPVLIEEDPTYWPMVHPLLEKFGHHIWNSELLFSEGQCGLARIAWNKLRLMPNLKALRITGVASGYGEEPPEEPLRLMEFVNSNPLPVLPNLCRLNVTELPTLVCQTILNSYGEQLELLEYDPSLPTFENTCVLPKLHTLKTYGYERIQFVEKLLTLRAPALSRLQLTFDFMEEDFPVLLRVLRHFEASLREFELRSSGLHRIMNWAPFGGLMLPNLEKFTVSFTHLESYDFLPGLSQCLQHFTMQVFSFFWRDVGHVVKRNSLGIEGFGVDCVCGSSIWDKIPTLKSVRIENGRKQLMRVCTRRIHEYVETQKVKGCKDLCDAVIPCPLNEEPDFSMDVLNDLEDDLEVTSDEEEDFEGDVDEDDVGENVRGEGDEEEEEFVDGGVVDDAFVDEEVDEDFSEEDEFEDEDGEGNNIDDEVEILDEGNAGNMDRNDEADAQLEDDNFGEEDESESDSYGLPDEVEDDDDFDYYHYEPAYESGPEPESDDDGFDWP